MNTNRVAVLGAGAFGTALALAFARAGRDVTLWDRNAERVAAMANARLCTAALPGLHSIRASRQCPICNGWPMCRCW